MKINAVIVDELPESCEKCDLERYSGNMGSFCAVTNKYLYSTDHLDHTKRHPDCPLIPDLESIVDEQH